SIVGVGTEFIVEVKLENSQREELALAKQPRETFPNLEILVVDDDLIVCESATATLEEMGINASWVDSGAKAIAEVKKRKEEGKPYDILLVDWKMPEMNGIETTREIRKIVGPEVTIIIMTAYEWVQIEHEAKLAGVNLMMSKPMFKASMVSALHNVLGKKEENDTAKKIDFDFTGKKVLLVEDHPLNVEVAKQLLSRKGFQVEHAENGVMAIEKFASASVGYYHAILMDIRMPIMDGLQATTIIRNLDKEDAKTIPIIAMTANAFAEDAESSKKAGMNAHLAKPIDPMLLYKTLDHAIKAQEWEE
ncbi:MAG: response regulator, partial [Anaerovoracaceae bacterium]